MRKAITALLTAAVAITVTACGGDQTPAGSSKAKSSVGATSHDTPVASLLVWADATRSPVIKQMAEKFTTDTGIGVEVVERDYGKMRDDFISQAPTGQGPDILIGGGDWTGTFVQNGVVVPVELGDAADDFAAVALESVTYEGKVYGLPYALENVAMFRNPALAPTAPTTMDEALEIGKAAVAAGTAKYPFLLQIDPQGDPYHMYPIQMSFDAPVFGQSAEGGYDPKNLAMCGSEGKAFAAYLAQMGTEKVFETTMTADIAKEAFVGGQSPFVISGPWNTADFQAAIPDVAIEPIPSAGGQTASPFVGTQAFFISAKSENQLAATQFVVGYLGSQEAQVELFKAGGRPPALTAAAQDPAVTGDAAAAAFNAVAVGGVATPNIPAMDAVWGDWANTEVAIIDGKGDPATLWDEACASIQTKIEEAA
ncbi:MAG: extracellular solute-binding protein [Bifidobacteriaceae bacterium]|jgi:arabinogalactan oligomer/maltooligosaccharide transport system substrate-binding protein|nr:extracellular solute-binding protein [Bifidobacteriaceae bacterium]